jgi:hypothetical protein
MIGFIGAIADLHTFQFTSAYALGFSVPTSRIIATDLNSESIVSNHYLVVVFIQFVLPCPNLYSTNLHNSLRTCSVLVLVLSTALNCTALHYDLLNCQLLNSALNCFSSVSYITTDGQSASLSWYQALIWGLRPDFYYV